MMRIEACFHHIDTGYINDVFDNCLGEATTVIEAGGGQVSEEQKAQWKKMKRRLKVDVLWPANLHNAAHKKALALEKKLEMVRNSGTLGSWRQNPVIEKAEKKPLLQQAIANTDLKAVLAITQVEKTYDGLPKILQQGTIDHHRYGDIHLFKPKLEPFKAFLEELFTANRPVV